VTAKGAREKDKVVVEILSYPTERYLARGVILEVLGRAGQYDTEIESVVRQYHLPREFDAGCLEQARHAAATFSPEPSDGREDITDKVIVTIDPPEAKDFDDAISLETDSQGRWVLGVHIADVCHFISVGSPLDVEAARRGNSVYLPGRTIPMLPEVLSNGICSLQPDQPRFVKSAYMTYDDHGRVVSRRYANSLIRSKARLTYEQADRILKGHIKGVTRDVIELLRNMVEANEAVASLLDRQNVPFMRRIHPDPDALTMTNMARLLRAIGVPAPRSPDRRAIQDILSFARDTERALAVNLVVLRSLERAQYAPTSIGHYALASTHYCHFTSPIRRYADLLVHRLLQYHLKGRMEVARQLAAAQDLVETGRHITFTEERADDAEKELTTVLILQMLSKRLGDEMDCVVTGLTGFGVFVQSQKFGIEGLIRLEDLGPDHWRFDKPAQCILGEHSGEAVRLGQPMRVRIVAVNVPGRQLSLTPVQPLGEKRRETPRKRQKGREKRGRTPKARQKSRKKGRR
jgi:ribonuclease R